MNKRMRLFTIVLVAVLSVAAITPAPAAAAGSLVLKGTVYYDGGGGPVPLPNEPVRLFVSIINWQTLHYQSWTETATTTTAADGSYTLTYSSPAAASEARLVVIDELCKNKSATPSPTIGFNGSVPDPGAIAFSPALVPASGTSTYTGNNFVIGPTCRNKQGGASFSGTLFRGYPDAVEGVAARLRIGLYSFLPQLGVWLWDGDFWTRSDGTYRLAPKYAARDFRLWVQHDPRVTETGARVPWPGKVSGMGIILYQGYPDLRSYIANDFYIVIDTPATFGCRIGVNAGGGVYTDTVGFRWEADQKYNEGVNQFGYLDGQVFTTTMAIAGTDDDVLYQNERYNMTGYRFWVDDGVYTVTLKFAEIYNYGKKGARNFDVRINGVVVDTGLDPYTLAGAKYTAVDRIYTTNVSGNVLAVDFIQHKGNATVDAIKVEGVGCAP